MSAAITKDASIWRLIGWLADRLDFEELQVVDHWDADLVAIGIARADEPSRLVYISTYRQDDGACCYECEQTGDDLAGRRDRGDAVSFEQLLDAVQRHLSVGLAKAPIGGG